MTMNSQTQKLGESIPSLLSLSGEIISGSGSGITAQLPRASIGDICSIKTALDSDIPAQVIGFHGDNYLLAPFRQPSGIFPGAKVTLSRKALSVAVGDGLLGRVIDALGKPLDSEAHFLHEFPTLLRPVACPPPDPMERPCIDSPLTTGIRSIDGFLTLGKGQRIGIFASAGIGKSTLLGMLVKNVVADVIVVGLVGERGREVREFVEETLGPKAMRRTVIVVATSDQPSLLRQLAPVTATTIAEHFRDRGKNVLLIIDSLTRTARAIRETSLAAGELPVRHGYTPSVYTELPKLVERAGRTSKGTITAAYTVLTNEDGDIDPLADEIKSLLDGHIVLSKDVANQGIRPAIDIVHSISRLMTRFHSKEFLRNSQAVVSAFATLEKERFTVLLGGTPDAKLQKLLQIEPDLIKLLAQETGEYTSFEETREVIKTLAAKIAT